MVDVYAAIYGGHYALHEASLQASRNSIRADMALLGISPEMARPLAVFNIGTGREAVALHEFGFGTVLHADLSPAAVASMSALRASSPRFANLRTAQLDLCAQALPFDVEIDVVYLNGVLHHLRTPDAAVRHIIERTHRRTVFFFRIYRSGSLLFFVVDALRRFVGFDDRGAFDDAAARRPWIDESPWLRADMWDDLFVPVLGLYRPDEIDAYFRGLGWRAHLPIPPPAPDHSDPHGTPDATALAFVPDSCGAAARPFPESADQLRETELRGNGPMLQTAAALRRALVRLRAASPAERLGLAMDLYWIARRPTGESELERHRQLLALVDGAPGR